MTLAWGATMTLAAGETSWGCKTFPEDGGAAAGAAAGAEGAGAGGGEGAEGIFVDATGLAWAFVASGSWGGLGGSGQASSGWSSGEVMSQ